MTGEIYMYKFMIGEMVIHIKVKFTTGEMVPMAGSKLAVET